MTIWNHRRKWTVAGRFCLFPFDQCHFLRKIWLSNAAIKAYPPAVLSVWRRLLCRSWGFWSVCARPSFYPAFSAWSTLCHLTCKKHRLAFWAHWRHIDFFPRRRRSDSHPNHPGHLFYPYFWRSFCKPLGQWLHGCFRIWSDWPPSEHYPWLWPELWYPAQTLWCQRHRVDFAPFASCICNSSVSTPRHSKRNPCVSGRNGPKFCLKVDPHRR